MPAISGVLTDLTDRTIKVCGIKPSDWPEMPPDFFNKGTRKRVSYDKTKCTFATSKKISNSLTHLVSCEITVEFVAKKYTIKGIEGWSLCALNVSN